LLTPSDSGVAPTGYDQFPSLRQYGSFARFVCGSASITRTAEIGWRAAPATIRMKMQVFTVSDL
jgi:hypothetical protein